MQTVHGIVHPRLQVIEAGTIDSETMTLDGVALAPSLAEPRIDTRLLPDGPHELDVRVADMSGNVGTLALPFVVDNTRPGHRRRRSSRAPRRRLGDGREHRGVRARRRNRSRLRGRAPAGRR